MSIVKEYKRSIYKILDNSKIIQLKLTENNHNQLILMRLMKMKKFLQQYQTVINTNQKNLFRYLKIKTLLNVTITKLSYKIIV